MRSEKQRIEQAAKWVAIVCGILALVFFGSKQGLDYWRKESSKSATTAEEIQKVSLRLAWIPGATFTGDYVAKAQGFWKQAGLDVDIKAGGFEFDAIKLVSADADTFGITSGPQLLQARAAGLPVVAIGATLSRSPIGWVAKSKSKITRPQDFVGKRIGSQFGTHTEITLEALMTKLGIPMSSLKRVPIKFDPRPFVVGDIDVLPVYLIDQPIDLRAQGLTLNEIDPSDYGVSLAYGNVYFATERTVREKPDLIRRFLRGAREGWMWTHSQPEAATKILLQNMPGSSETQIAEKVRATLVFAEKGQARYEGVFTMNEATWQETAHLLARFGDLKLSEEISRSFSNKFLVPD